MSARVRTLLVHGGIDMDASQATFDVLARAGAAGLAAFDAGGSVAAAVAAVAVLEADPRFNAGLGSVLNADGAVECDAGVSDGVTGHFAGVGALVETLHPVRVAAALLSEQRQVLVAGNGAAAYARTLGHPVAELRTDEQLAIWRDYQVSRDTRSPFTGRVPTETVGALAIDADGRVAAASSTGGLLHKRPGRIGDSAILGAGLYADGHGGVVVSGVGEAAVELALARWTVERLQASCSVSDAVREAVLHAWRERGAATAVLAYDIATGEFSAAHAGTEFLALRCTDRGQDRIAAHALAGAWA